MTTWVSRQTLLKSLDIILVPLIALMFTLKLQEIININLVLILATIIYLLKNIFSKRVSLKNIRFNGLDFSVLLVAATEIFSSFRSTYGPNSFYFLVNVLFFVLFYFLVRFNLKYDYQRITLSFFITGFGLCLSCLGLVAFYYLNKRLNSLGFHDITDFRNYIYIVNPVGLSIGEWVTVYFMLLPFPIILFIRFRESRWARWLFLAGFIVMSFTIMTTFIRGAYVAILFFLLFGSVLFFTYRVFSLSKLLFFNLIIILSLFAISLSILRPVLTTTALFKTRSQMRSFEGRKSIWKDSFGIVKDNLWFGIGAYNFPMRYVSYKVQDEDSEFALRPYNYFLQILIEKGVIGLLAYCLLLFNFFRISHRKIMQSVGNIYYQSVVILFMTAYASIIVRDLSESSILVNQGVNVLLFYMMASNAQLEKRFAESPSSSADKED